MHEIATQNEFSEDLKNCGPDALRDAMVSDTPLTPAHISAISACLTAVDGIFEVFLSMDVNSIRCLPVFNFVRVAYAVVILIKMYFAASSTKSELGKVINKDEMKVEQHIENLLDKFRATAADEKSRPAAKFLVVLVMLRSWFQKQNQAGGAPDGPMPCPLRASAEKDGRATPQQPDYNNRTTANAGLQILSEIAANDSAAGTGAAPRPSSDSWMQNNVNRQSFMYDAADTPGTGSNAGTGGPGSADGRPGLGLGPNNGQAPMPWLNNAFSTDLDYSQLGDGFAQAMDLTLAGITDGSFGLGMENGMSFVMQQPPWMPGLMMGMGVDEALTNFGTGGPAIAGGGNTPAAMAPTGHGGFPI
jgi:hypothetical protein